MQIMACTTENTERKAGKALGLGSRGRRKLTDAHVLQIVRRYQAGSTSHRKLASEYGVTAPAIAAILCGRSYAWLTRIGLDETRTQGHRT
jgi:hypothetical protein